MAKVFTDGEAGTTGLQDPRVICRAWPASSCSASGRPNGARHPGAKRALMSEADGDSVPARRRKARVGGHDRRAACAQAPG